MLDEKASCTEANFKSAEVMMIIRKSRKSRWLYVSHDDYT